jgi:hypothetical protein
LKFRLIGTRLQEAERHDLLNIFIEQKTFIMVSAILALNVFTFQNARFIAANFAQKVFIMS